MSIGPASSSFFLTQSGFPVPGPTNSEIEATVNPLGHLLTAQALPEKAMLSSRGATVMATTAGSTTFSDSVQALPTTKACFILNNAESPGGKSYIIDTLSFATTVIDATESNGHMLVGSLQTAPNVLVNGPWTTLTNTTCSLYKMNCNPYNGKANVATTTTAANGFLTVVDNKVFTIGTTASFGFTAVGGDLWISQEADIKGRIVLPPGCALGLSVVTLAIVAAQIIYGATWHEVQLPVLA